MTKTLIYSAEYLFDIIQQKKKKRKEYLFNIHIEAVEDLQHVEGNFCHVLWSAGTEALHPTARDYSDPL